MDCRDPAGPMWIRDPHIDYFEYTDDSEYTDDYEPPMTPQNMTLAEWLTESITGNLERAFGTSGLIAVSERRRLFDAPSNELEYTTPKRLGDDEIIGMMATLPDLTAPASAMAVVDAERALGFSLPPLLRRLYLEVANGEMGPGDGILGVPADRNLLYNIVTCHEAWNSAPDPFVPPGFVWFCDWGSAIWSLADCNDPLGQMWIWDPMGPHLQSSRLGPEAEGRASRSALVPQNMTLAEWLTEWLRGSFTEDFKPSNLRAIAACRSAVQAE